MPNKIRVKTQMLGIYKQGVPIDNQILMIETPKTINFLYTKPLYLKPDATNTAIFSGVKATSIEISDAIIDKSSLTYMFNNCINLKKVTLKNVRIEYRDNTQKYKRTHKAIGTFYQCQQLKEVNFQNITGELKLYDTQNMFYECRNLKEIDLSCFDMSSLMHVDSMFYGCRNLEKITFANESDIRQFYTAKSMSTDTFFLCSSYKDRMAIIDSKE
jgi:surface protein